MNGTHGLPAWRWLFILEGIPSCLSSFFVFFFLPDFPETVKWLSAEETELATSRLEFEASHGHDESLTWAQAKATLMDWRLYGHYAVSQIPFQPPISKTLTPPPRSTSASPHHSPVSLSLHQVSLLVWATRTFWLS